MRGSRPTTRRAEEAPPSGALAWAAARLLEGEPVCLATVVEKRGSAAVREGWLLAVTERASVGNLGGGLIEERTIEECLRALEEGRPRMLRFWLKPGEPPPGYIPTGMVCGGEVVVHVNPIFPPRRIHVFGVGHVGYAIARLAHFLGMDVFVYETDPRAAEGKDLSFAKGVFIGSLPELLRRLEARRDDAVIVTFGDEERDSAAVEAIARLDVAYKGWLSSRSKAALIKGRLAGKGVPREALDSVRAPMGLDIGARTPEEVALATLAEVISVFRRSRGGPRPSSPSAS